MLLVLTAGVVTWGIYSGLIKQELPRMSLLSSVNFVLLSGALILFDRRKRLSSRVGEIFVLICVLLAFIVLVGYAYSKQVLYIVSPVKAMALPSAISFFLLSLGILGSRTQDGAAAILVSTTEGGLTARRMLPVVIILPFLLGLGGLWVVHRYWLGVSVAMALVMASTIISFLLLVWGNAVSLHSIDLLAHASLKQLSDQKELTSMLIQNSTAPTFVLDEDHKVIIWNRACEELTGVAQGAVLGTREHWKAFYRERRQCLADVIVSSNIDVLPQLYTTYTRSQILAEGWHGEGWFDNVNGRRRYLLFDAAPVYNASGVMTACIETLQDITARVEVEQALAVSEDRYKQMIQNLPVGFYRNTPGPEGKFILANPTLARVFGYDSVEDFLKARIFSLYVDPADRDFLMAKLLAHGELRGEEVKLKRKDGTVFWGALTAKIVKDASGQIEYFDGMVEDISERKRVEQLKSDFVSLVSHQLKTPVAEMRGYIYNMLIGLTGELTPKQREYLEDMQDISSRNYRLIADLLNVSRIERGVISVDVRPVMVRDIVEQSLSDYYDGIKRQGLSLTVMGLDHEIIVLADKDKTAEAVGNAINNAMKFTRQGGITIAVSIREARCAIEVRDTGAGIPEDRVRRLFKRDMALEGGPIAGGGTGLGLYIAKQFMVLQRGDVSVVSSPGQGSVFTFELPLAV